MSVLHARGKGDIGENIACEFLARRGFCILDRNYQKKWGELDIVAEKEGIYHFFEVKSRAVYAFRHLGEEYSPEENVHTLKVRKLRKIIDTYLSFTGKGMGAPFQFHILCVFMNVRTRRAHVCWMENIILC